MEGLVAGMAQWLLRRACLLLGAQPMVNRGGSFASAVDSLCDERGAADRIAGSKYPRLTGLILIHGQVAPVVNLQAQILDETFVSDMQEPHCQDHDIRLEHKFRAG